MSATSCFSSTSPRLSPDFGMRRHIKLQGSMTSAGSQYRPFTLSGLRSPIGSRCSTIIVSDGSGSPPTPKPLAGQFTVVVSMDLPPNTLIGLTIMRIDFTSPGISIREGELKSGCSFPPEQAYGCINARTINPPPVTFASAFVSINGERTELFGGGGSVARGTQICHHTMGALLRLRSTTLRSAAARSAKTFVVGQQPAMYWNRSIRGT